MTPQLDHVIAKALTKDPHSRYRTAGEFAAAAAAALNTGDTAPPSRPAAAQELPRAATPPPPKPPANGPAGLASAPVDFIGHLPHTHAGPSKRYIRAGAAAAAALAALGLTAWLVLPTSPNRIASSTTAIPTDPTAAAKLAGILPAGYSADICTPAIPNSDLAASAVSCGPNADPGGPPTATYTLARNRGTLQALFGRKVATATAVLCPGNIQSPGPWRRPANSTAPRGTVFCGLRNGRPLVAWTTDDKLLVGTVEAQARDSPTLDQLYTWWASHS